MYTILNHKDRGTQHEDCGTQFDLDMWLLEQQLARATANTDDVIREIKAKLTNP